MVVGEDVDVDGAMARSVWDSIPVQVRLQLGFDAHEQQLTELSNVSNDVFVAVSGGDRTAVMSMAEHEEEGGSDSHIADILAPAKLQSTEIACVVAWPDLDIDSDSRYAEVGALEALGAGQLKHELDRRGMKTGGTVRERAERLLAVRGVPPSKIDVKHLLRKR